MYHRTVGDNTQIVTFLDDCSLAKRNRVVVFGYFTTGVFRPGYGRLVRVAVKGSVVDTLGFEKYHWIIGFNGADQQALGIVRV